MSHKRNKVLFGILLLFSSSLCLTKAEVLENFKHEDVVSGLANPWSFAFLPDGRVLITEREGRLRIFNGRTLSSPVKGLPDDILFAGQGGLLDVVIHPDFIANNYIYLSYAAGTAKDNGLKVVRAKLQEAGVTELTSVLEVTPKKDTPVHYGGRIVFLPDNTLLISSGDGFDYREDAQRLDNQLGKILRIKDDGGVPVNNPHNKPGFSDAAKKVYSLGHRNPQGLVFDGYRNRVFEHEHGPAGGDEINIIHAGNNYGWPVVTNGQDYSGASITPFRDYPGMELPLVDWTPSIAPSGMALYTGFMFEEMRGDLLVSTLKSKEVRWVELEGTQVTAQHTLFTDFDRRIRDIKVHADGSIYLLFDGDKGKLVRIYR